MSHIKLGSDTASNRWRVYDSQRAQLAAARRFRKLGYRHVVTWKDTQGWGVEAALHPLKPHCPPRLRPLAWLSRLLPKLLNAAG